MSEDEELSQQYNNYIHNGEEESELEPYEDDESNQDSGNDENDYENNDDLFSQDQENLQKNGKIHSKQNFESQKTTNREGIKTETNNLLDRSKKQKKSMIQNKIGDEPMQQTQSQDDLEGGYKKSGNVNVIEINSDQNSEKDQDNINDQNDEQSKEEVVKLNWKEKLDKILEHNVTTVVMTIITIFALFGDDVRILSTDKTGDPYFWFLACVCFVAFTIEIIIASLVKKDYWLGFFFWLDVISTLSLLLDIGWISQVIFNSGSASSAANAAALARAGRASRVGTKAGRIVRIVRLVRLVKLYKHAQQALANEADNIDKYEAEMQLLEQQQFGALDSQGVQSGPRGIRKISKLQNNISYEENKGAENLKKFKQNKKMQHQNDENNADVFQVNNKSITIDKDKDGPSKPTLLNQQQILLKQPSLDERQGNEKNILLKDKKKLSQIQANSRQDSNVALLQQQQQGTSQQAGNPPFQQQSSQNMSQFQKKRTFTKSSNLTEGAQKNRQVEEDLVPQETKVGQKLSDLTTQRVITLVMSIMISIPVFSADTYIEYTYSYGYALYNVLYFQDNQDLMSKAMGHYIDYHVDVRSKVIFTILYDIDYECCAQFPNSVFPGDGVTDWEEMRTDDISYYTIGPSDDVEGYAIVDIQKDNFINAILSICRTIFVSVILAGGAMLFSKDVEDLVLTPIEKMLQQVQLIASNPLEAAQIEEQQALAIKDLQEKGMQKELQKKQEQDKMETSILEQLIIKIGALLALGFGEAGSKIIAENMSKNGEIDPLIPGKKMMAVFGFCYIKHFNEVTEVLQEDVMVFVNEIAEITHGLVDKYCGQSNKNIGEAFLLVWSFSENQVKNDEASNTMSLKDSEYVKELCDLPILAFLKIIAALQINEKMEQYKKNKKLQEQIPGYQVQMGYGLHIGWAIEGAIGSSFKIDASYLSPNVNMAARLEAATKQFGTMMLISGHYYNSLSQNTQQECRLIDRVTVKGSVEPMELYTIDISLDNLQQRYDEYYQGKKRNNMPQKLTMDQKKRKRVFNRIKRNKLRNEIQQGKTHVSQIIWNDPEIQYMREVFQPEFYEIWEEAFDNYLNGEWEQALEKFEYTYDMIEGHQDGPSLVLINYIKNNGGKAPQDWNRYRKLTEK